MRAPRARKGSFEPLIVREPQTTWQLIRISALCGPCQPPGGLGRRMDKFPVWVSRVWTTDEFAYRYVYFAYLWLAAATTSAPTGQQARFTSRTTWTGMRHAAGRLIWAISGFHADRRSVTSSAILVAAVSASSCSQTRTDSQPASVNRRSVSASRRWFVSILARQNAALFFGQVACSEQPCQKHPSTNTATRAGPKTMSASRRTPFTGRRCTRNRSPCACRTFRNAISMPVFRDFCRLIRLRVWGVVSKGPTADIVAPWCTESKIPGIIRSCLSTSSVR